MKKANLTLYTAIGDPERITAAVQELFSLVIKDIQKDEDTTTLMLQDDTQISFHLSHARTKPEFIEMHTEGMANYFAQAETDNRTLKEQVLQQIRCFNCVVGIVFETDDNNERTNYIVNSLFDVADKINGYLLYPNMCIYNSKGKLVFSSKGESEFSEFIPTANADLLDGNRPTESEADRERRERSIAILKEQGIPYIEHLLSDALESEAHLKSREEMVRRAAALFAVAVYSEVMLSETPDRKEALTYFSKMDEIYGIYEYITPAEADYIANAESSEHDRIQFVWRYENCAVLLWAAGIVEELPYPSEVCDVPVIAGIFWQHKGMDDLLAEGTARTREEILDAADLSLRYDWACVDARINHKDAPAKLDGGIVMERHYTFNWIIGANNGAEWDEIQPTT